MNTSPAMTTSGKFSSRLPNSIQVFSVVWPVVVAATRLLAVQSGQSGQPRPDLLSRTASPVDMMITLATTAASASWRSDPRVGRSTGPETRSQYRRQAGRELTAGGAGWADTLPIVGDLGPRCGPGGAEAGRHHAADGGPFSRRQPPAQKDPAAQGGPCPIHP